MRIRGRTPTGYAVRTISLLWVALGMGCTPVGVAPPAPPADLPPPSTGRTAAVPSANPVVTAEVVRNLSEVGAAVPLPPLTLPLETGDVRALWIVRTALTHPDSARMAVRRAAAAGFNTLLVQVRGRGDAYYESRWEPRASPIDAAFPEYDPLATVLEEARGLGLRVHAWVNVHVVASAVLRPQDPRHLAVSRPDLLAVPRSLALELFHRDPRDPSYLNAIYAYTLANSDRIEGVFSSPTHPRVQEHLVDVVSDLLERYPVDGLHLDYLRFPSTDFDYSRAALETFRAWVQARVGPGASGAESRWPTDPFAYVTAFPELWDAFRLGQVTYTMERLFRAAKTVRPGTIVSAAVFADLDDGKRARFQDWEGWLAAGIVDLVAPMAYTPNGGLFEAQMARAVVRDPRRVWAGVGIYQDSFTGAVRKGQAAQALGVGGIALFSYDWAAGPGGSRAAGGEYLPRFVEALWGAGR